jgi:hypothetical protein
VSSPTGTLKLELLEIVPLPYSKIGPEEEVPHSVHDLASLIHAQIVKKSKHYASAKPLKKVLLFYVTDWRFRPSQSVLDLVRFWTAQKPHRFDYIYSYRVVSEKEGEVQLVYPVERSWEGFDPERLRNRVEVYVSPMRVVHGIYELADAQAGETEPRTS